MRIELTALSLIFIAITPQFAVAQTIVSIAPTPDKPLITITVQESSDAAPDIATLQIGVEALAPTATAALSTTSVKMKLVLAALAAQNIANKDIRTSAVTVGARYDYRANQRVFLGYSANNSLGVIVRQIDRIGPLLDAVTASGATEINGPQFAIENPKALRSGARDRAVVTLDTEAQAYAKRTGHIHARLLTINDGASFMQPVDIIVTASRGGAPSPVSAPPPPPVMGGQLSVGVTLTGVYRLED